MNILNLQIKEKDQEYRLNELKIRELRRQLPAKVLKPLENNQQAQQMQPREVQPTGKQTAAANRNRQSSMNPPQTRNDQAPLVATQESRGLSQNASQAKVQLKPPVPKSTRKSLATRSASPQHQKTNRDANQAMEKTNYVD